MILSDEYILKWVCPRCNETCINYTFSTNGVDSELEVVCGKCGLHFYPDNLPKNDVPNRKTRSEPSRIACPNCAGRQVKRFKHSDDGCTGLCLTCGFRWCVEEFLAAEALEREEAKLLEKRWRAGGISGSEYEELVAISLESKGFTNVTVTKASGDHGADILAVDSQGRTVVIQCKCYTGSVGQEAVQQAVAAREYYRCDRAMVVTNSVFTPAAVDFAERTNTMLIANYLTRESSGRANR